MYEKGNGSIRKDKKYRKCSILQVTSNFLFLKIELRPIIKGWVNGLV